MQTRITLFLLIMFVVAGLALPSTGASAAPPQPLTITHVSALDTTNNGWTVELSDGTVLFVELRAFETGSIAPAAGAMTNFADQGWLPILGYYGYATFQQHGRTYHGYRH